MEILKKILNLLRIESSRDVYPETFKEELNYQCGGILIVACLLSVAWLPYIPIDMELHPDRPFIVVLRVGLALTGMVILLLSFTEYFRNKSLALLTAFGSYLMIATGVLTGIAGGASNYIGGYIFILCILAMAPITRRSAYTILFVSIAAFFTVGIAHGMSFETAESRYSLNDLTVTVIVVSFFIYILDSIRYNSWRKSKSLEQSQKVIVVQRDQLENQITLAAEVQKQLLPSRIPEVKKASLAYNYLPMMGVGGDFVDLHYSSDGRGLGLFICDVSGHGVAAAIISSMVKMSLAGWAENIERPSEMLKNLYNSLSGKISAQFVTASICYLDLETGLLRIASAGHPPATVLRRNGFIEEFRPRGRIINDMMAPDYEEVDVQLERNDKVILYTDGIIETFNEEDAMYGEDRFFELLTANRGLPPGEICEIIMEDLSIYSGKQFFEDDITVLITEYLG